MCKLPQQNTFSYPCLEFQVHVVLWVIQNFTHDWFHAAAVVFGNVWSSGCGQNANDQKVTQICTLAMIY